MPDPSYPTPEALIHRALQHVEDWEASWGAFDRHPSLGVDLDRLDAAFDAYLERMEGNYPFHHPHYAGQMLKPPHPGPSRPTRPPSASIPTTTRSTAARPPARWKRRS